MRFQPLLLIGVGAGAVLLAAISYWLISRPPGESRAERGELSPPASSIQPATPTPVSPAPVAGRVTTPAASAGSPLAQAIDDLLAKLRLGQGSAADLDQLRKLLLANPKEAIAAITGFLQSGKDASTKLGFAPGPDGGLAGAPTLRVFLMDVLGQLAKTTGSGIADQIGRQTLETKTSPDEWAVSLRNVAWSEPAATDFLAAKMREMLSEPAWMANPSGGLLEAFDVAVFSGDPTFITTLSDVARTGSPSLQRAALVAMDRLSESAPLAVMNYLNANPAELADRPFFRADYFAKADLSQPEQEAAIEAYLGRQDVAPQEKTKLLGGLATASSFISDNLLTTSPAQDDGTARQQALSTMLQRWLTANRFPALQPQMQQIQAQLRP